MTAPHQINARHWFSIQNAQVCSVLRVAKAGVSGSNIFVVVGEDVVFVPVFEVRGKSKKK